MPGVYLQSSPPSPIVAAGFVAARGWAHETAADRGITLAALEQLANPGGLADRIDVRVQVGVDALSATLLVQGSHDDVALVLDQIRRRLVGEPLPARQRPEQAIRSLALDVDALWSRYGAQSFGLLGYAQYGHRDATDDLLTATVGQLTEAGLVPFGVDSDAAGSLETWSDVAPPPTPDSEPVPTLPAHLPRPGSMTVSLLATTGQQLAATVITRAIAPLFAASALGRPTLLTASRDLGPLGTHEVLHLPGRDPAGDELTRLVTTLARLRLDGPTETEIVVALDRMAALDSGRARDPTSTVLARAQRQAVGVNPPATGTAGVDEVRAQVVDVLASMIVMAPEDAELTASLAGAPGQVDQSKLTGRAFPPAWYLTAGPAPGRKNLRVGPQGVSVAYAKGGPRTIRDDDVVAVERWADGDRRVVSRRGYTVHVDPLAWRRGDQAIELLDSQSWAVPVEVGQRSPEVLATKPDEYSKERIGLLAGLLLVSLLFLAGAIATATGSTRSTGERVGFSLFLTGLALAFSAAVVAAIRQHRRLARRSDSSP